MSDKKPHKPSKADIAKQFDLPERQSKITTLLNQARQAYCICRSSDSSRFMIGCDACEEWYHGDCINISEREARYIRQYYCDRCRLEDPSLTTRFKLQKREHEGERDSVSLKLTGRDESKKKRKEHSENKSARRSGGSPSHSTQLSMCGTCTGCVRTYDCGRCDNCLELSKMSSTSARVKIRCKQRLCVNILVPARSKPTKSSSGRSKHRSSDSRVRESTATKTPTGGSKRPSSSVTVNEPPVIPQNFVPQQCLGQNCVKVAVPPSKYCSHSCGMRLATARIYQVLPQRIQEWSLRPCIAEASDRRALLQVRSRLTGVREALNDLEKRRAEIDVLVERARNAPPANPDDELEPEEEGEMSMYCITCGHEIHSRTAVKHMEKCFNKYEAQSSFGSVFKTRIEGQNMFCDFYNVINRTYCKRLRVLCPEHSKEPKVSDTDVCGCPLVRDVFIPTGEFCRAPRKSCLKHHAWEKLRRAEVDLERVRQWLKVDDLMEQERNIRYAMASRAGVLGLMLHSTYDHEVMELITSKMQPAKKET